MKKNIKSWNFVNRTFIMKLINQSKYHPSIHKNKLLNWYRFKMKMLNKLTLISSIWRQQIFKRKIPKWVNFLLYQRIVWHTFKLLDLQLGAVMKPRILDQIFHKSKKMVRIMQVMRIMILYSMLVTVLRLLKNWLNQMIQQI